MKLYYLDGYGRAEPIRLLLNHAKQEFEDIRLTREEIGKHRADGLFEFGQVPVLENDGERYAQSHSILRSLGTAHGYYSTDAHTMWRIDSLLDAYGDLQAAYWGAIFSPTEEAKKAAFETFFGTTYPKFLERVENRLKANSSQKYIVGDKLTIADFLLSSLA